MWLVETARALPGLGRSLYGKEGGWRGGGRGRRRWGAVVRERPTEELLIIPAQCKNL